MKSMVKKTKDNSGATIIMALLFTLICVLVSTVLLASAGTASRDVSRQREQQQAYLAVSSAVGLLQKNIENCKFIFTDSGSPDPASVQAINSEAGAAFVDLMKDAMKEAQPEQPAERNFTLSCENIPDVAVNFKMYSNGLIEAACKAAEGSKQLYKMTATFAATAYEADSTFDTWKLSSASKG